MMRARTILSLTAAWLCSFVLCSTTVQAGMILVGTHSLQANTPGQIINILAGPSFSGEVAPGLNFNLLLDDGGSVLGGVDGNAPTITKVDLKPAGGLFTSLPNQQTDVVAFPKLVQSTIVALSIPDRPVILPGAVLAQVTIDTTGITGGNWVIDLDGTDIFPTSDFAGNATTIVNGTLSISSVPEPGSACLFAAGCLILWRRRRHRASPHQPNTSILPTSQC